MFHSFKKWHNLQKLFSNFKDDFAGGITAGLVPLPRNMALGALVFSPYGDRTPLSRIMSGLFPMLVLMLLYPFVAKLPNVVLAGMLIMIAIGTVVSVLLILGGFPA